MSQDVYVIITVCHHSVSKRKAGVSSIQQTMYQSLSSQASPAAPELACRHRAEALRVGVVWWRAWLGVCYINVRACVYARPSSSVFM